MRLHSKVALVTGGSSGIGKAIATAYLKAGAQVAICGRDLGRLKTASDELGGGANLRTISADVRTPAGCRQAVAETIELFGGLDILVNSHGIMKLNKLEDVSEAEFDDMISTNVKGGYFLIQAAVPEMRKRGKGSIINMSSIAGPYIGGVPTLSVYCATKAAITGITHNLALELGPDNIRVNSISPGNTRTPLNEHMMDNQDYVNWINGRTPLRRMGLPSEIANVAVFLGSDEASYMTGSTMVVDGGWIVG